MKTGFHWNAQTAISLAAILVAAAALIVSIWSVRESRLSSVLAERPYLGVYLHFERPDKSGFILENAGPGPAIIRDFRATLDGALLGSHCDFREKLDLQNASGTTTPFYNGYLLRPGQTAWIISVQERSNFDRIVESRDRIDYSFCYCSLRGQCWSVGIDRAPEEASCSVGSPIAFTFHCE